MTKDNRTLCAWTPAETTQHREIAAEIEREDDYLRASLKQRSTLEREATRLADTLPKLWEQRNESKLQRKLLTESMLQYVAIETILGRLRMHRTPSDYWHIAPPQPIWVAERIAGDDETIDAIAADATTEYHRLQNAIQRKRTELQNRCKLAELGLIPRFSFRAAWATWKQYARTEGAEARSERKVARSCERELSMRQWEHERAEQAEQHGPVDPHRPTWFVADGEVSDGWKLPTEQSVWSGRDYAAMSNGDSLNHRARRKATRREAYRASAEGTKQVEQLAAQYQLRRMTELFEAREPVAYI